MHKTRQPYTFLGEPNLRLRAAEYDGWHIQVRESQIDHWMDVPNGYHRTLNEAVKAVSRMIE